MCCLVCITAVIVGERYGGRVVDRSIVAGGAGVLGIAIELVTPKHCGLGQAGMKRQLRRHLEDYRPE